MEPRIGHRVYSGGINDLGLSEDERLHQCSSFSMKYGIWFLRDVTLHSKLIDLADQALKPESVNMGAQAIS
jgi:hypothetical protein